MPSELVTKMVAAREKTLAAAAAHVREVGAAFFRGEPAPDTHCVMFKQKWDTHMAGPCAVKAHAAVKAFLSKHAADLAQSGLDAHWRTLIETAKEYADVPLTVDGCFVVRNQQWNAILEVLHLEGVGVTGTGVTGTDVTGTDAN